MARTVVMSAAQGEAHDQETFKIPTRAGSIARDGTGRLRRRSAHRPVSRAEPRPQLGGPSQARRSRTILGRLLEPHGRGLRKCRQLHPAARGRGVDRNTRADARRGLRVHGVGGPERNRSRIAAGSLISGEGADYPSIAIAPKYLVATIGVNRRDPNFVTVSPAQADAWLNCETGFAAHGDNFSTCGPFYNRASSRTSSRGPSNRSPSRHGCRSPSTAPCRPTASPAGSGRSCSGPARTRISQGAISTFPLGVQTTIGGDCGPDGSFVFAASGPKTCVITNHFPPGTACADQCKLDRDECEKLPVDPRAPICATIYKDCLGQCK